MTLALEIFTRVFQEGQGFLPALKQAELERVARRSVMAYSIADELRTFRLEPSAEWKAMLQFMNTLRPRPNPHMDGHAPRPEIREAAERGQKLFYHGRQGCALCHRGTYLTNTGGNKNLNKPPDTYDVGTDLVLDVPPLVGLWDSGPYLHDGRATTLREVITTHNNDDWHGQTSHLSDGDLDDLATFLLVAGEKRVK